MPNHSATPAIIHVDATLSLQDAEAVVDGDAHLAIEPAARERCTKSERRLAGALAEGRHVYGLTTGFGPLAGRLCGPDDAQVLQQNLVHHLASGVGPNLPWRSARALVLARLMSILQGYSGASAETIAALEALLASAFAPEIPSRGTVGASGDLTPMAHLVLCLQGRGAVFCRDGTRRSGPEALRAIGCRPLSLRRRDGLALVNGTAAMTGQAVLNACAADRAIRWSLALSAAFCEAMKGHVEAWHPTFSRARPHPGQATAAAALREAVDGSGLANFTLTADRHLTEAAISEGDAEPGQDAYTLRCVPQVVGAVIETADWHSGIVVRELNAATDNPIFPECTASPALHGGNFMGQHVALASDALSTAVTVLAGLAERQVARLTDETLNRGLPPFLHRGRAGLNSGFMGAQVTATAVLGEMRARSGSAAIQSISTNGANQDVVSMGTISARHCGTCLDDLFRIEAILALCVAQALELRQDMEAGVPSRSALALCDTVRGVSPRLTNDRPLGAEIEALAGALARTSPPGPAWPGGSDAPLFAPEDIQA